MYKQVKMSVNDLNFRKLWRSILRGQRISSLHNKLQKIDALIEKGLNLEDEYIFVENKYNEDYNYVEWINRNTPFKQALLEYEERLQFLYDRYEKEYVDQLLLFVSHRVKPTYNSIIVCNRSHRVVEEFLKRYECDNKFHLLSPFCSNEYIETLIGFRCLDVEKLVQLCFESYEIEIEFFVLPIEEMIIYYTVSDIWKRRSASYGEEELLKKNIKSIKYYSPPASLEKIRNILFDQDHFYSVKYHKEIPELLSEIWKYYFDI